MDGLGDGDDGGGELPEATKQDLYAIVYTAVKNALMEVFATFLLLGLSIGVGIVGIQLLLDGGDGTVLVGGVFLGVAVVFAAAAFDLLPSFHEKMGAS